MTPEQEAALRHARMTPQELREEEGVRDWAALYDHDMEVLADLCEQRAKEIETFRETERESIENGNRAWAEVERLTEKLEDETRAGDLHRELNRKTAHALGKTFTDSWHDNPECVAGLKTEVARLTALAREAQSHIRHSRMCHDMLWSQGPSNQASSPYCTCGVTDYLSRPDVRALREQP